MPRSPRELSYSEMQRLKKPSGAPVSKQVSPLDKAIATPLPGNPPGTASREEVLWHLRRVLVPGLEKIATLLAEAHKNDQPLTEERRRAYSTVWEGVAGIMKTRRPRPQEADVTKIARLLNETREISREQIFNATARSYGLDEA